MAKKPTRRKRKSPAWYQRTGSWVLMLCLAGGLLLGLLWLASQETAPPVQPVPPQPPPMVPGPVAPEALARLTEGFLESLPLRSPLVKRDLDSQPPRYTVDGEPPETAVLQGFQTRLQRLSPRLSIRMTDDGVLVVDEAGTVKLLVFFVPPLQAVASGPQVAIIMDDLGRSLHPAKVLLSLQQPVTFSILPGEAHARQIAQMAHAAQREVLLHVPMEPQGYPAVNPGEDALFVKASTKEISHRFRDLLTKVPYAVGTNNHMGSRFTENRRGMEAVMAILKEQGLFFVDSLTTARSVGVAVAEEKGVPVLKRDVFLDNVADVDKIAVELHRLADKAVRNGQAIGICHPYPETLQALQRELPRLAEQDIKIVPVSRLLASWPGA